MPCSLGGIGRGFSTEGPIAGTADKPLGGSKYGNHQDTSLHPTWSLIFGIAD